MSMSTSGGSPGWAKGQFTENCEMNVTPFVDVMLVLLIIFMVAAPLATVTIPVDLPPSSAQPPPQSTDPVFVSIQAGGEVYVQEDQVSIENLADAVTARTNGNRDERIYLRADERIIYRFVMDVMNRLQDAGFYKVALVAEDLQGS